MQPTLAKKAVQQAPKKATASIPRSKYTTSEQFIQFLQQLQGDIKRKAAPYVFPKMLSYINAQDAKVWRDLYDVNVGCGGEFTATVSSFCAAAKHGKKAWFGCAILPPTKWVGAKKGHLKNQWHAIAFAIIAKKDGGKALLLYDTEVKDFRDREPQRVTDVLAYGALKQLADWTRRKSRSLEVWVNKSRSTEKGKERCVAISCQKLAKWISYGDMLFTGEGDPRIVGKYHCISRP